MTLFVGGRPQSGLGRIKANLGSAVRKGKLSQGAADAVMARVKGTLDYNSFGDVDMVRHTYCPPSLLLPLYIGAAAACACRSSPCVPACCMHAASEHACQSWRGCMRPST